MAELNAEKRNLKLDLCRILSMFGIVMIHLLGSGWGKPSSVNNGVFTYMTGAGFHKNRNDFFFTNLNYSLEKSASKYVSYTIFSRIINRIKRKLRGKVHVNF